MILTCGACRVVSDLPDGIYQATRKDQGSVPDGVIVRRCPVCKEDTLYAPARIGKVPPQ